MIGKVLAVVATCLLLHGEPQMNAPIVNKAESDPVLSLAAAYSTYERKSSLSV